MRRLMKTLLLSSFLLGISNVHAETVQVPESAPQVMSIQLPGRGMTMTAVEEKFGSPRFKSDPVGEPPITRWDYPDFVVYFEHEWVIHAVVAAPPAQQ